MGCNPNARAGRLKMAKNYPDYQLQPRANWEDRATRLPTYRYFGPFSDQMPWKMKRKRNEWQLTYQRPRKKVSSGRTLEGCGHQRDRWRLGCGTSGCRTNVLSIGCRSCSGPEKLPIWALLLQYDAVVNIFWRATGKRDEIIKVRTKKRRSRTQSISEWQSQQWWKKRATLCFCSSKLRTSSSLFRYIDSRFSEG